MERFKSNSSSSNKKIIFTSYTADWCPHCVDFKEKTYGKLVDYFANSPNIKITNVDCTNDNSGKTRTPAGNQIDGFPTLVINTYENGKMSNVFIEKLRTKEYNHSFKKDYYFLVFNKQEPKDIIINSVKGLRIIYVNNNNLPFQVCWSKNRDYEYNGIIRCIGLLLSSMEKIKHNWKKNFIDNIKNISKKRKRLCYPLKKNKRIKL